MALIICPDCSAQVSDAAPTCPRCGRPVTRPSPAVPKSVAIGVIAAVVLFVVYEGVRIAVAESAAPLTSVATPPTPPRPATASPAPPLSPLQQIVETTYLVDAIALAKPKMRDTFNDTSDGAFLMTAWAATHMMWQDAAPRADETSIALVQKDSESARGKRLCAPGSIIEIATSRTAFGEVNEGLMYTDAANVIRFVAVNDTGDIVKDSPARFCGVVCGKWDYANSAGGTGHAVIVVGMFDLPSNRKLGAEPGKKK